MKAGTSLLFPLKGGINFSASPILMYPSAMVSGLRVSTTWVKELVGVTDMEIEQRLTVMQRIRCSDLCLVQRRPPTPGRPSFAYVPLVRRSDVSSRRSVLS
jgi:hypothetical protein